MADITANVDAWSATEANNLPTGSTTIGTNLDDNLRAVQAGVKLMQSRWPFGGAFLINGEIARSVGSSALTLALKGYDDADPSATNKVYVRMPTVTSNLLDGGSVFRTASAALSLVVSSGSTLGHTSAVACPVYMYVGDNAGTLVLGVSTKFFGGQFVASSTAEGGAGASDTATTLYSTAAQTNIAWVCVGRWKSTQTTAGTWATTTGEVQLFPFPYKAPAPQVITASGTYTRPWDLLFAKAIVVAAGGGGGGTATNDGSSFSASGGGGGGGTAIKTIPAASIGATETVTVGAGGTAGAAGNSAGGPGGTSSFGSHCSATGGVAGAGGASAAASNQGGSAGGAGSGGDVNINGGPSTSSHVSATASIIAGSMGGNSAYGGGGQYPGQATAGIAGKNYGGGASGVGQSNGGSGIAGAAGASGIVIVEEFF